MVESHSCLSICFHSLLTMLFPITPFPYFLSLFLLLLFSPLLIFLNLNIQYLSFSSVELLPFLLGVPLMLEDSLDLEHLNIYSFYAHPFLSDFLLLLSELALEIFCCNYLYSSLLNSFLAYSIESKRAYFLMLDGE